MPAGTGRNFSARSEQDAQLFAREFAQRGGRRPVGAQRAVATGIAAVAVVALLVWVLVERLVG